MALDKFFIEKTMASKFDSESIVFNHFLLKDNSIHHEVGSKILLFPQSQTKFSKLFSGNSFNFSCQH